jgi:carbon storage regulator
MLVLSRRIGERIVIDDKITVTVVEIRGGQIRLGIEAPKEIPVWREEMAVREMVAA